MSEVRVNKLSPRSGTTVTLGDSGDTISIPSGVTFDASSGGLAGTLTTAAQPNITSVGTLTSFTSTGIDDNATSTAITIDSSERVGIGTASPSCTLHIDTNTADENNPFVNFDNNDGNIGQIRMSSSGDFGFRANTGGTGVMFFQTGGGSERMRIDSSGNVLINTTDTNPTGNNTKGFVFLNDNEAKFSEDGLVLELNRIGSDGGILHFLKDGTQVGNIGTFVSGSDSTFHIAGQIGTGIRFYNFGVAPTNESGTYVDNSRDLGSLTVRWDDVYASNGTIQTSDQNEKQSIQSLTTAEMNVAKRLSSLIKTFKWNNSVEEKGDSARTHTGIIAQDVQQAFTDEGLDAGNYALFISSTWWEKEIPVEATEEQEAYTYTDIKEEATDGYTERTRLGVRYPELLSFIQAYNDQRFTELEARITTLENA